MVRCLVLMLALAGTPALSDDGAGVLRVTGEGVVAATPDVAVVTIGISRSDRRPDTALNQAGAAASEVVDGIIAAGVPENRVQTTSLSLSPEWERQVNAQRPRLVGYTASTRLRVTIEDINRLGPLLDQVVGDGANMLDSLRFDLSDPQDAMDRARRAAVADAVRKARLYAEAASVTLGALSSIAEAGTTAPGPLRSMDVAVRAEGMPIAEGEIEMRAQVEMVWSIGD